MEDTSDSGKSDVGKDIQLQGQNSCENNCPDGDKNCGNSFCFSNTETANLENL